MESIRHHEFTIADVVPEPHRSDLVDLYTRRALRAMHPMVAGMSTLKAEHSAKERLIRFWWEMPAPPTAGEKEAT